MLKGRGDREQPIALALLLNYNRALHKWVDGTVVGIVPVLSLLIQISCVQGAKETGVGTNAKFWMLIAVVGGGACDGGAVPAWILPNNPWSSMEPEPGMPAVKYNIVASPPLCPLPNRRAQRPGIEIA